MFDFRTIALLIIVALGGWLLWLGKPWTQEETVVTARKSEATTEAAPPPPAPEATAPDSGEKQARERAAAEDQLSKQDEESSGAMAPPAGAPPSAAQAPATSAALAAPKPHMVDILFGTDRAPTGNPKGGGFDSKRGDKLTLGRAKISVPPNHTPGTIERPLTVFTIRLESEDPNQHFVIAEPPRIFASDAEFLKAIPPSKGRALLFVHGYNTSFEDGLYRAAQITYDLNFDGPSFFYSWPSKGNFFDYGADNQSVENTITQGYFRHFVALIAERAKVKNITVIAHSKGNDLVLRTLGEMAASEPGKLAGHISHLVLASPDVDRDVAKSLIARTLAVAGDITLYANSKDIPLIVSACFNSGLTQCDVPRAGALLADGTPLVVLPADSIDASAAKFDLLGFNHNAYVYDDFLRDDLLKLIRGQRPPNVRSSSLKRHLNKQNDPYWRYQR